MIDPDFHRKNRIKKWISDNDICDGEISYDGIENLLLNFEHYLDRCEEERQKA